MYALNELMSLDVQVMILSGRNDEFTRHYARLINSALPYCSFNGALVKNPNGSTLLSVPVGEEAGEVVLDITRNYPSASMAAFTDTAVYSQSDVPVIPRYLRAGIDDFIRLELTGEVFPHAVLYVVGGPYAVIQEISLALVARFRNEIEKIVYQSNQGGDRYYLEVKKRGVNKSTALREVASRLDLRPANIAAIGDFANDIEMCKFAGVSAAMNNAIDELKRKTDLTTQHTHHDGGSAEFFRLIIDARNGT